MIGTTLQLIARDPQTAKVAWHCFGPDLRGACGRIAIGDEIPCVGKALSIVGAPDEPYVVPAGMTLCPVTLALALGVPMGRSLPARTRHAA